MKNRPFDYDVVISTFSPGWTHVLARDLKSHEDFVWIADYRDAPTMHENATRYNREYARRFTSKADAIIGVSQGVLDEIGAVDTKMCVISNGFDARDSMKSCERKPTEKFSIFHAGTIYDRGNGEQEIGALLRAIEELMEDNLIERDDIEVVYAGSSSSLFSEKMAEYPSIPYTDLGYLERERALQLMNSSSVLLLVTWNTHEHKGILGGKLFEYWLTGTPVLAVCNGDVPNSLVAEVLDKTKTGFCYEPSNASHSVDELKGFLLQQYTKWKQLGYTVREDNEGELSKFQHPYLAARVGSIIDEINAGR